MFLAMCELKSFEATPDDIEGSSFPSRDEGGHPSCPTIVAEVLYVGKMSADKWQQWL